MHRLRVAGAACALAFLTFSGCATITKGSSQPLTVSTDPAGATCLLERDGKSLAAVNPTPGTVTIEKARAHISVLCKKEGYLDNTGVVASSFQTMTLGNILIGGLIGFAVDTASGAINQYPPMISLMLIPTEFDTTTQRDAFFERVKLGIQHDAKTVKGNIEKQCGGNCEAPLKAADEAELVRLAEIETKRQSAKVKQP